MSSTSKSKADGDEVVTHKQEKPSEDGSQKRRLGDQPGKGVA